MSSQGDSAPQTEPPPSTRPWTYPTRTCRLCLEEVPPSVTLYPPGLPLAFQRPVIEYLSDNEYGRLCKPCKCKGGMRYIHELCLRRCRTESRHPGAMWKCDLCGYEFNFNRLTMQKYLGSKKVSSLLTILFMIIVMFFLGFVADPILNFYSDPYETIVGHENIWQRVEVEQAKDKLGSWGQHFVKGLVSMGVLSFLRTMLLNPFHWFNLRNSGLVSGRTSGRATTGRDRAVNVSWLMIAVGIVTAFYLFYQWVQIIIGRYLQRLANNIVDTQLPDDDDDLKPPSNFKFEDSYPDLLAKDAKTSDRSTEESVEGDALQQEPLTQAAKSDVASGIKVIRPSGLTQRSALTEEGSDTDGCPTSTLPEAPREADLTSSWASVSSYSSAVHDARNQGWSFNNL